MNLWYFYDLPVHHSKIVPSFLRASCWCMILPMRNPLIILKIGSEILKRYVLNSFSLSKRAATHGTVDGIFNHFCFYIKHASSDVEKMVLGNKCDMDDRRQVSKTRGEQVRMNDIIKRWFFSKSTLLMFKFIVCLACPGIWY